MPPLKKLWSRITIDENKGCWNWQGKPDTEGYGEVRISSQLYKAHVYYYQIFEGVIPEGLELDHLCRNRICVNPKHLEPVTHQVNVLRGKSPQSINALKTHCIHGHILSVENTYESSRNNFKYRQCKICTRERAKRYLLDKKQLILTV
jgi:hypothetical protein